MISRRPGRGHGAAHLHLPVTAPGGQQERVDSRGECQADRLGRGLSGRRSWAYIQSQPAGRTTESRSKLGVRPGKLILTVNGQV